MKIVVVEYEIPPLRAIYTTAFEDYGYSEAEVIELFLANNPRSKVRKVEFKETDE
jgi:hypothetical protein